MRRLLKISSRVIFVTAVFFVWDMGASILNPSTSENVREYSESINEINFQAKEKSVITNKTFQKQLHNLSKSVWNDENIQKPWRDKNINNSIFKNMSGKINKNGVSILGLSEGNVESLSKIVTNEE